MTIVAKMHRAVKTDGLTITEAIARIIPGADPELWRRNLANYDPNRKPVGTRRRAAGRSRRRRTNYAGQALARGRAMAELTGRANNGDRRCPKCGSADITVSGNVAQCNAEDCGAWWYV